MIKDTRCYYHVPSGLHLFDDHQGIFSFGEVVLLKMCRFSRVRVLQSMQILGVNQYISTENAQRFSNIPILKSKMSCVKKAFQQNNYLELIYWILPACNILYILCFINFICSIHSPIKLTYISTSNVACILIHVLTYLYLFPPSGIPRI